MRLLRLIQVQMLAIAFLLTATLGCKETPVPKKVDSADGGPFPADKIVPSGIDKDRDVGPAPKGAKPLIAPAAGEDKATKR